MIRRRIFFVAIASCFFYSATYSEAQVLPDDWIPGDYDLDGYVNIQDALVWEATYGSTTELFADGNLNGVVDQADYDLVYENYGMSAFLTASIRDVASDMAGSVVSIIYDSSTGEVSLHPADSSERIYAFKLITTGTFNEGIADAPFQQFVPDPNGVLPDGNTFVQTVTEIGQIDINGSGLPDEGVNLGPILPAGLSASDLLTQLSGSQMFGGSRGQVSIEFVEIPEPATLMLLGIGGSALLLLRRRPAQDFRTASTRIFRSGNFLEAVRL